MYGVGLATPCFKDGGYVLTSSYQLKSGALLFIFSFNSLVIQKTVANSSGLKTIKHLRLLLYTGEVANHPSSIVVVSMCEGKMVCVF